MQILVPLLFFGGLGLPELMLFSCISLPSIIVYFLPTILAKDKAGWYRIFLVNLLLGWTFIGWIIALVWVVREKSIDK
jgi:hypothetical protein